VASSVIARFIEELRAKGLGISPSERIDASKAALAVDLGSKASFRAALRATLAKSLPERELFDEVFDAFFAPPRGHGRKGRREAGAGGGAHGKGRGGEGAGRRPGDPEARRAPKPGLRPSPEARKSGKPRADGERRRRESSGRLRRVVAEPERRRGEGRPERGKGPADRASDPRRRDLRSAFTEEEERLLAREIPALIERIRLRRGRRMREGSRGRLWVKKTIRASLAHGGVPFALPMRERRPRQPRVVLLVDVSWSVARAAGLFLLLIAGFGDKLRRLEVHLFVDRLVDATDRVRRWSAGKEPRVEADTGARRGRGRMSPGTGVRPSRGGSFAGMLAGLKEIDPAAASDYGRVFYHARDHLARSGGRDTVLVILGDGRTNRADPLAWAFGEIASRCRRVIWIDPEPRALWDSGDSMLSAYLPACDVACEARDLAGLAHGVREILRAL